MSDQEPNEEALLANVPRFRFTIGSILILTTVFAAFSLSLSYYVRALWASGALEMLERLGWKPPSSATVTGNEIGMFAIIAAMIPTVFLVVASWFLKAAGFIGKLLR